MELLLGSIWQMATSICNCMFLLGAGGAGGSTPKSPLPLAVSDSIYLTQCVTRLHKCACQMTSKSVKLLSMEHECDRRQTDRPRYGEMRSYRRLRWTNSEANNRNSNALIDVHA